MRSDYVLYVVAVIFFILTGVVATMYVTQQLWIVATAVLGLAFIGLGYSQKPRPSETIIPTTTIAETPTAISPPPPPAPTPITVEETIKEQRVEPTVEEAPATPELTRVKGIGGKRAQQLKAIGINNIAELANASRKDVATKLQISPKITGKWIDNAKEIAEKL